MLNRRRLLQSVPALAGSAMIPQARVSAQNAEFKGRLRPGLVAYSFRGQLAAKKISYEDLIRYAAGLGFEGLDTTVYWFPDTSDQFLANLRRTAYRNGISLYSVAARVRLCQPTAELRAAEVENAKKWIDVAYKLGASHVRVFGGTVPKGVSEEQAIDWAAEVLKGAAEYSGPKGLFVGVEDDGGLSTNAAPTIAIIRKADSPWAGMNVDAGNFPKDGYAQTEMSVPYAVSTHIKSTVATPEGTKEKADFDRLFALFAKGGYRGFVSLEYEGNDPETAVPRIAPELIRCARKYSGA
jgi:L-ribulose-5-phosphate 3-epimerase